jgi:hypothetical protein
MASAVQPQAEYCVRVARRAVTSRDQRHLILKGLSGWLLADLGQSMAGNEWLDSRQLSRSRRLSRTAGMGHKDPFPPPRLSAG